MARPKRVGLSTREITQGRANYIRQFVKETKIKSPAITKASGVNEVTVRDFINGRTGTSIDTACTILNACGYKLAIVPLSATEKRKWKQADTIRPVIVRQSKRKFKDVEVNNPFTWWLNDDEVEDIEDVY